MLYIQILKYVNICMLYSNSNKQKFWNVVKCAVTQLPLLVKKKRREKKKTCLRLGILLTLVK